MSCLRDISFALQLLERPHQFGGIIRRERIWLAGQKLLHFIEFAGGSVEMQLGFRSSYSINQRTVGLQPVGPESNHAEIGRAHV